MGEFTRPSMCSAIDYDSMTTDQLLEVGNYVPTDFTAKRVGVLNKMRVQYKYKDIVIMSGEGDDLREALLNAFKRIPTVESLAELNPESNTQR